MNASENTLFTEIRGNKRCLIEGVERLLSYSDREISVLSQKLIIVVSGEALTLDCLNENRIGIKGDIRSVAFERENVLQNT
ncbi:MAG: YabP/YqfC family sporulation protein [Eubacteriales bacterium]